MVPGKLFNVGMLIRIWGFRSENQFFAVKHDTLAGNFMVTICLFTLAITTLIGPHVTERPS